MSAAHVSLLSEIHEAFERRDLDGFLQPLDENIDFEVPSGVPYGGKFHGRDGIIDFLGQIGEYIEDLRATVHERIDAGDIVVELCTLSGRGTEGGTDFDADAALVWRFEDGTPVAFKEYSDTARIRAGVAKLEGELVVS